MKSEFDICSHHSKSKDSHIKSKKINFNLHPIHQYSGVSPYVRKPIEVGHFSLDGKRSYHDDDSQLRYYVPPVSKRFRFNLREGYNTYIEKDDDVKERLTHLLMWITKHRDVFMLKDQKMEDGRLVMYIFYH